MKWLQNILDVWRHEFIRVLHDEGVLVFFLVVPLLYPLLYAYLYNNETVREVPTLVVDNCKSSMSRDFLRRVDATCDVKIIGHCADMQEAQELIRKHKAYCLIYVPSEFQKNILEGKQSVVELYSDMSGLLYYKAVLSSCTEVSLEMNQDIKMQRLVGATKEQAETFAYPIKYEFVPMFNTQSGFATFVIPAVLMLIIQQTLVLGVGMIMGDEHEKRRKGIVNLHVQGRKPLTILLGKAGVYLCFYAVIAAYFVCIPNMFSLIHIWQWKSMLAFMLPYILSCIFFSMIISVFARDRESFIVLFVFLSVPMMFISGISWPGASIPSVWKALSYIFPSTLGINGFVRITEMGALASDVRFEIVGLWIQAIVFFVIAWLLYRKNYLSKQDL
ncbi:MAG: ABC transporter permease [Bacteroidales bacterium]|nr:ABC transporter permease [Bacteroidales bacterium]